MVEDHEVWRVLLQENEGGGPFGGVTHAQAITGQEEAYRLGDVRFVLDQKDMWCQWFPQDDLRPP